MARIGRRNRAQELRGVDVRQTSGGLIQPSFNEFLGPRNPQIVSPAAVVAPFAPLDVRCVAVGTRVSQQREYRMVGYIGWQTIRSGTAVTEYFNGAYRWKGQPHLGPRPPAYMLPMPSQRMMTIGVTCAARGNRITLQKRCFPLQNIDSQWIRIAGGTPVIPSGQQSQNYRMVGPRPPTRILSLPLVKNTTVQVFLQAIRERDLARNRARPDNQFISMVGGARGPPSAIWPPTVLAVVAPVPPIEVTLAGRTRADAQRRAPHSKLSPPATLATAAAFVAPPIQVELARNRVDRRRAPFSKLFGLIGATTSPTPAQGTVRTSSEAVWTRLKVARQTHSKLSPPVVVASATVFVASPVEVSLVAVRSRLLRTRTRWRISPPKVINPAAAFFASPVETRLAPSPRQSRRPRSELFPPAVVAAPAVFIAPPVMVELAAVKTRRQRPTPRTFLRAPTVLTVFFGPKVKLAPSHRASRKARPKLPLVVWQRPIGGVKVWTAWQNRLSRLRRPADSKLSPPTAVLVGVPVNITPPVASGTTTVGSTVSTTDGTWTNSPTSFAYQWQQSLDGITWTDIPGATSSTYVLAIAQLGLLIRSSVIASNATGPSLPAYSNVLGPVTLPITAVVCDVLTASPIACTTLTATVAADGTLTSVVLTDSTLTVTGATDGTLTATPSP